MKCPFCGHAESKVTDSRNGQEINAIRRRRECLKCAHRFTTFETIDLAIQVRKRDGSYEDFAIEKLIHGIEAASRHTRISRDQVRILATQIANEFMEKQIKVVDTMQVGEIVMERLRKMDTIAYIRFACVYRRFKELDELMDAIHTVASEDTISSS